MEKKVYFSVLKKDEEVLERVQNVKDKYVEFTGQKFIEIEFEMHRKSLTVLF